MRDNTLVQYTVLILLVLSLHLIFAATILQARAVVSEQRALSDYSCTSRMRMMCTPLTQVPRMPTVDREGAGWCTSTRTDGDQQCVFSSEKTIQGIDHRHVNLTPVIKKKAESSSASACRTVLLTKCVWGSLDHQPISKFATAAMQCMP
jgi:hypothetical protein